MSTAHSPGPWSYRPHSVDSNYMLIYCSNDKQEGDNLRGYCGEPNARLIAAAPELLEALQTMPWPEHKSGICHLTGDWFEWLHKAKDVIAKATGGQP